MNITPQKITSHAYFSPGDDCLNAIISSIEEAEQSIKICVFTISDDRITDAIVRAHRKGIRIKILTDNEKLYDKGSDIRELAAKGLEIRVDESRNHMHHKFAIFDNTSVLTGSYNWTRSAALYNHENVLITDNKSIVLDYCVEFDRLWEEMVPFEEHHRYH
ncbi:MAG: phospholipase D-like domain-containing protein [Hymenobacteraceae bacterium]|nr:phospholipase D-like domain-containing protein [Hymenobacteraceae bacterium]MDX5394700.1 phospholipase D-like domain-containing protein [Hymenobacteraceae bacterium]MDX5510733.1 phospholipase D-like domain-containing protein [Hymenobacteraceae bacterium]